MKNSLNKFRGKNNKDFKKNSDFGYFSKNKYRSEKNDRFLNNFAKTKKVENLKKNEENNTFSSLKRRNSRIKSNSEFPNKNSDMHQKFNNDKILMIGYGVNIRFMRLLVVIERLIGFGVLRKFILQTNSIFCLRILNQKEFLLKRFLGTGFRN